MRAVIDHILEDVARFVAQLATLRGTRTLVADVPDRFFFHLASALEAQGLSKKLVADMCGLALRSYQKRLQRLAESRSDVGRTLWEAVYAYLSERAVVSRSDLDRRFGRDDLQMLGSVLHDLVDGGLVFRSGTGAASVYRAAREGEVGDDSEGGEALVWLSIYRFGPIGFDALLQRHRGLDEATLEGVIESLMRDGRVTAEPGERLYRCRELVTAPGERSGAPAAIVDHVHAVFATLSQALAFAPDDPRKAWTGGSTYSFELAPGDAHEAAVAALLPRLRTELTGAQEERRDPRPHEPRRAHRRLLRRHEPAAARRPDSCWRSRMSKHYLWALAALPACLSNEAPGGEVGSETHFLSGCVANDECADGFACMCGLCTTACSDTCTAGECAAGNNAAVASWCGGPLTTGLCLEGCVADPDCGEGTCRDGFCGAGLLPDGVACETSAQCEGGICTLGYCGPRCMFPDEGCAEDTYCLVPGGAAGVCIPGAMEPFPKSLDGGNLMVGQTHELTVQISNAVQRPLTIIQVAVETRVSGEPPTEVVVTTPLPIALPIGGLAELKVALTPATPRARAYRLVIDAEGLVPRLVIDIDFVGVSPSGS